MAALDAVVLVCYLAGIVALGSAFGSRQKDARSYFLADHDVSWLLILLSIVATETSTMTFLSVPALVLDDRIGHLGFLQVAVGFIVGRWIVALWLLPSFFQGGLQTAYELLRAAYGPVVQRVASGLFLVTRTVADGLRLYLAAIVVQELTGLSGPASVWIMGGMTFVYTVFGGMRAVVWTDALQLLLYLAAALLSLFVLVDGLPGGWQQMLELAQSGGRNRIFNLSFDWHDPYTLWVGLLGGAFFSMASHGADHLMVQRYLSSRSLRHAQMALATSGLIVFAQFALFLTIGLGLYGWGELGLAELANAKPDQAYARFIVLCLPPGVRGLIVAGLMAAAMSTLSSSWNSSAHALYSDFLSPWLQGRSSELLWARLLTAMFALLQGTIALLSLSVTEGRPVVEQALTIAGMTTGVLLGVFALHLMHWRGPALAVLWGLVCGSAVLAAVWMLGYLWPQCSIAWPLYPVIGATATALGTWLVHQVFVACK